MEAKRLAGLKPEAVFGYFEKICSIPHGSRNTKAISDFLVDFAREQGLRYIQDESNNVILFQEGTCGMEDHPPVILQGHMDMVCEKDAASPLDMAKDGLDVTHDGVHVFARGTTLGALWCAGHLKAPVSRCTSFAVLLGSLLTLSRVIGREDLTWFLGILRARKPKKPPI